MHLDHPHSTAHTDKQQKADLPLFRGLGFQGYKNKVPPWRLTRQPSSPNLPCHSWKKDMVNLSKVVFDRAVKASTDI